MFARWCSASLPGKVRAPIVVDPYVEAFGGEEYRGEANKGHREEVGGHRPGGAVGPLHEGRGDQRCQGAAQDTGHLVAQGYAGVAHPRLEELGDQGTGYAVEGTGRERPQAHGDPEEDYRTRVHEPEEGEGEERQDRKSVV